MLCGSKNVEHSVPLDNFVRVIVVHIHTIVDLMLSVIFYLPHGEALKKVDNQRSTDMHLNFDDRIYIEILLLHVDYNTSLILTYCNQAVT